MAKAPEPSPANVEDADALLAEAIAAAHKQGYAEGVSDACAALASNSRLGARLAHGGTLGEDLAGRIADALMPVIPEKDTS
jgi:hypothetical protein